MSSQRNNSRNNERGSALLIVFLFAAIIAISLYMEMPSYAFEAKRNKEQLLVDRGSEYAHAVKLYYRKFRSYPASIAALENTNNMRFLRHKFKDPMTGEDNWRLLHAGPGGQIIDSKVNPIGLNANGQNVGAAGSNSVNGSSSTASASNTAFGFSSGSAAAPSNSGASLDSNGMLTPVATTALPQRPPEMPVSGGGGATTTDPANVDPTQSLLPSTQPAGTAAPASSGAAAAAGGPALIPPSGVANPGNPMQGVQQLISNPNPPTPAGAPATTAPVTTTAGTATSSAGGSTSPSTSSGMGVLSSGGIAGVASIAKGRSIKSVNEQTDYSLWEFYYDPTKDTSAVGAQSGMGAAAGVPQLNNPLNLNNSSSSSSSNSNSSTTPAAPASSQPGLTPTPQPTTVQPQQP